MQRVEANMAVSVSDLKKSPSSVMSQAGGEAVAILNHNRIMAYMLPADMYEAMMEELDDMYLASIAIARQDEEGELVDINDLCP